MFTNKKEIENVSKLIPFKRYEYFIRKIADSEELWTIVDSKGIPAISRLDNKNLISFWSSKAFIKSHLESGWSEYTAIKIDLEDLENTFIPLIEKKKYLIDVFPVGGKSGFVVSLKEFIRDLNEELEQYE